MKHIVLKILVSPVSSFLFACFFLCIFSADVCGQSSPQAIQPVVSQGQALPAASVSPSWQNGNQLLCMTPPISTAKPYLGYNGISNENQARMAWCQAEPKETITLYCEDLSDELRAVQVWTLSPDCQAAVLNRQQEYNEILNFLNP